MSDAAGEFSHSARSIAQRRSWTRVPLWQRVTLYTGDDSVAACLVDLSPGGALVSTSIQMLAGREFSLGLHLSPQMEAVVGLDYLSMTFRVVVSETGYEPDDDGSFWYRCQVTASPCSKAHERAVAVVTAACVQAAADAERAAG